MAQSNAAAASRIGWGGGSPPWSSHIQISFGIRLPDHLATMSIPHPKSAGRVTGGLTALKRSRKLRWHIVLWPVGVLLGTGDAGLANPVQPPSLSGEARLAASFAHEQYAVGLFMSPKRHL